MANKYIILTLADGGEMNGSEEYRKYSAIRINATSSSPSYYQNSIEKLGLKDPRIEKNEEMVLSFDYDNTRLFIVRENAGGGGFVFKDEERTDTIGKVIKKHCEAATSNEESGIIVIAHVKVEESKLKDCQIMTYRTGGDFSTNPEWGVVCYIIDDCLLKGQFPVFKVLKNKIKNCAIPKNIRIKIHELELLIAPLKIETIGNKTKIKGDDGYKEFNQIRTLVVKEDPQKVTLQQLLEDGGYTKDDEISSAFEKLKIITAHEYYKTKDLKYLCNDFLDNLHCISEKIFFAPDKGGLK